MKYELKFRNNPGSDQELLEDMNRISTRLKSKFLTQREYDEIGKFSSSTISRRFGSWNKALRKAGLKISNINNIPKKDLFDNLESIWVKLGRQPKRREMLQPLSKYSERGYIRAFGSWRKALEAFVQYINSVSEDDVDTIRENREGRIYKTKPEFKHKTKRNPSESLKVKVLMRDGNKCRICGVTLIGDEIHFDHIKPWSKGGETTFENLQILCKRHNLAKSDYEIK